MQINKKRIINLTPLQQALKAKNINRVSISIPITEDLLKKLNLDKKPDNLISFLPKVVGPISKYNADGKFIVHKDLPKEQRIVNTYEWHWKDWHGTPYSEMVDITRDCYPRNWELPPSVEFVVFDNRFEIPNINVEDTAMFKHCINLCLEYAHSCDILTIDGSEILPKIKRLNWEVLPPGEYPFKKLKELVEKNVNPHDKRSMTFILSRIQYLCEKKPIQICSGLGGFSGYFVYIFEKNTIVVDSCKYGNATYILNDDWQSVSKRTKKEILDAQLHKQRIIHSTKWQKEISKLF